ncbi:1891_t:CDS:2, partial [Diversispora eburnea]
MIYDYGRLFFSLAILGIFNYLSMIRWKNYDDEKHGYYWVITPVIETAIWMYATILSIINLASQQRGVFHIRGHLDLLYLLTVLSSLINIHSLYSKYGMDIKSDGEYYLFIWILIFSSVLLIITIFEPEDDPNGIYSKPNSK